jgi:hypothetical protein
MPPASMASTAQSTTNDRAHAVHALAARLFRVPDIVVASPPIGRTPDPLW